MNFTNAMIGSASPGAIRRTSALTDTIARLPTATDVKYVAVSACN